LIRNMLNRYNLLTSRVWSCNEYKNGANIINIVCVINGNVTTVSQELCSLLDPQTEKVILCWKVLLGEDQRVIPYQGTD
jgi:hypothetical protein